jgi:hypothetical protein
MFQLQASRERRGGLRQLVLLLGELRDERRGECPG